MALGAAATLKVEGLTTSIHASSRPCQVVDPGLLNLQMRPRHKLARTGLEAAAVLRSTYDAVICRYTRCRVGRRSDGHGIEI